MGIENGNLREMFAKVEDADVLRQALGALLDRIDGLEARLGAVSSAERKGGGEGKSLLVREKRDRLAEIRHGLTELNERMQRPYIVSAELQAVKDVLDTLAESGACNSVILEGEPGTGKTQWAYSEVGQELQDGKDSMLIHVRVKETMTAQDLLYSVDDVRRLSDAQARSQVPDAIREEAASWKARILSGEVDPTEDKEYLKFKAKMKAVEELGETGKDLDHINYIDLGPLGEAIKQSGEGKTVWLVIDEIEKGREELMTGMLDEIENLTFTIAETGTKIKGDKRNLRIVITTNTEDSDKIPSSFRRRSLYHFLEYPTQGEMAEIVSLNFPRIEKSLLDYALDVYYAYHEHPQIQKKPSTPELLAWIEVLSREFDGEIPDDVPHKEILLKFKDDQEVEIARKNLEAREDVEKRSGKLPHFVTRAVQGVPVFRLNSRLSDEYAQGDFARFYAELDRRGIHFVTPHFEDKKEGWDTVRVQTREFQIVMPGVEVLGDGYYAIPEDQQEIFTEVLAERVEVLTEKVEFTSIDEKNGDFTKGKVNVDGYERDAYRVGNKTVVSSEYAR
jgi:MoxR-like ATPase